MNPRPRTVLFGVTVGMTANTLLRGQLAWLAGQGWDVHVVSSPGPRLERAALREGFHPHPVPMERAIRPLQDLRGLARWLAVVRRVRPAVTNVSTPKAALLGSLASWLLRVPRRVYLVRGLRLEGSSGTARRLLWLTERVTIALSTDVVVVSPSLGAELRRNRLLGGKRVTIVGHGSSNGVDAAAVQDRVRRIDRDELRRELGIAPTAIVVGYVGRVVADKGIDTLLRAVSLTSREATVLLVGPLDDPDLGPALLAAPRPIVQVGMTDDPWAYYAVMDVLCLPTRREGFPNVVLEAAAAGVPSISTDATGAVDAIVPGVTGITVPVDDASALAAAIDRLTTDPAARADMGRAARRRVVEDFRPEDIWTGIEAIMLGERCALVHTIDDRDPS